MTKRMIKVEQEIFEQLPISITKLASMYAPHPDAHLEIYADYDDTMVYVTYNREETDEERNMRLVLEAVEVRKLEITAAKRKEKAKREFERLRKTYGFE